MCIREWCTSSGRFSRFSLYFPGVPAVVLHRTGMDTPQDRYGLAVYQVCTVASPLSVWIQHSLMGTPSPKDTKSFSTHGHTRSQGLPALLCGHTRSQGLPVLLCGHTRSQGLPALLLYNNDLLIRFYGTCCTTRVLPVA